MTISTTTSRASYNGNGVTTIFAVPFRFFANTDLVVQLVTVSTGASTTLTLTTHYTVTGADDEDGGSLTMVTAPAVGQRLVIRRVIAATQEVDYVAGDPFPAETHERALDRLTMLAQQGEEVNARALVFPSGDTASGELPAVATRANKLLGFDSLGELEVTAPASGSAAELALDLASTASGKGAELVGYDGVTVKDVLDHAKPMQSYTALRAYTGTASSIRITTPGLAGFFARDNADATSADNGGTVIVDASARRWTRQYDGAWQLAWWGVKADKGVTDDTAAWQDAVNAAASSVSGYYGEVTGHVLDMVDGVSKITSPIVVPSNAGIHFVGKGKTRSTVFQATANTDAFQLSGTNFRGGFRGMRIGGVTGQVGGASKAINIAGSGNQIYIEDCWINNFGYAISGAPTSDSNFTDNVIEYCLTPLALSGSGNAYFFLAGNQFYNCGPVSLGASEQRASFDFNATASLTLIGNRVICDLPMSPQTGGLFLFTNCSDVTVSDTKFIGTTYDARTFIATGCTTMKFHDNVLKSSRGRQFGFTSCNGVELRGNTIAGMKTPGSYADHLMLFDGCAGIKLVDNTLGAATLGQCVVRSAGSADFYAAGNTFDGGSNVAGNFPLLVQGTAGATISGNTFKNPAGNTRDFSAGTSSNVVFTDNRIVTGYIIDTSCAPITVRGNTGTGTRTSLSAVPASGTWPVGHEVLFDSPAAAGWAGARCTVAGTPGTWKRFGQLEA